MTAADLDDVIGLAASIPEAPHWPRPAWEAYLPESVPPRQVFLAESGGHLAAFKPAIMRHGRGQVFLAESGGHLAGFVAGQTVVGVCELESIAVAHAHRRSGLATALLNALTEWAAQNGTSKIQLEVRSANASAIAFYKRAGFSRDGLRPGYYNHPLDDALLMTLPLPPSIS